MLHYAMVNYVSYFNAISLTMHQCNLYYFNITFVRSVTLLHFIYTIYNMSLHFALGYTASMQFTFCYITLMKFMLYFFNAI